ncbi:MAG: hypothetical protein Q8O37_00310 [Sulfuricellaceae bacterium]|nr:hypothetical protein [Sulfuricellaceae bacterium]
MRELLNLIPLVVLLSVTGCASLEQGGLNGERQVRDLASERWAALIAGKMDDAYQYLSPATRETQSLELYKSRTRPGRWKKATVDSVVCAQDKCDVVVLLEYSYKDMKSIESRLEEAWLLNGGKWWYVPRK